MELISMLLIALVVAALSIATARLGLSLTLSLASQATLSDMRLSKKPATEELTA